MKPRQPLAHVSAVIAAGLLVSLGADRAGAQPAPTDPAAAPAARPGLTLAKGKLNVTLDLELDASKGAVGKPFSIAPDVSYGVTSNLTLALVHSTFLTTGFRGAAGKGLCVTGATDGCPHAYDNVGVEGLYEVSRGAMAVAANAGVHAVGLDAGFYAVKLGAKARYTAGKLAINAMPAVYVAATKRGDAATEQKDTLWVPLQVTYKVTPPLLVGLGTGVKGPLEQFGDGWGVSLGCMATYAIDPRLTVGASWVFGKLLAPDAAADPKGIDQRAVQVWASYTP